MLKHYSRVERPNLYLHMNLSSPLAKPGLKIFTWSICTIALLHVSRYDHSSAFLQEISKSGLYLITHILHLSPNVNTDVLIPLVPPSPLLLPAPTPSPLLSCLDRHHLEPQFPRPAKGPAP